MSGGLKLDGGEPWIVHLAFHHRLTYEHPTDSYLWQNIALDGINRHVVAAWLGDGHIHPNDVPYGIDATGVCFDKETGAFLEPPIGKGLTCATFITAVLRHLGFPLIQEATWPQRDDDIAWQEMILDVLKKYASDEHVEATRKDIGAKRFRPDEVVGAAICATSDWPVTFSDARLVADAILGDLAAARSAPAVNRT